MAYRVKSAFHKYPNLSTVVNGKKVALLEAFTYTKRGTAKTPPQTVNVPLATQAELKAIFERGDPCVEQYADTETKQNKAKHTPGPEETPAPDIVETNEP